MEGIDQGCILGKRVGSLLAGVTRHVRWDMLGKDGVVNMAGRREERGH